MKYKKINYIKLKIIKNGWGVHMWKIKNMAVIHSNSNPDALIKSSLLVNYIDSKSDKTKSEVYSNIINHA